LTTPQQKHSSQALQWEVLSTNEFRDLKHAEALVLDWCYGFYNHKRRHTHTGQLAQVEYETLAA
jgi:hypothetical protein